MIKLRAIKNHRYAGKNYLAGESYEATKGDTFVLIGARLSEYAPEEAKIESPQVKEMIPEKKPIQQNKKKKYKRRYIV